MGKQGSFVREFDFDLIHLCVQTAAGEKLSGSFLLIMLITAKERERKYLPTSVSQ